MRLQEIHPALVHFPIAILPTALAVDAVGRLTGEEPLLRMGKVGIAFAAGSGLIAGVAGLIAQEASRFGPEAGQALVTHRNVNLGVIALTGWMAARRSTRRVPSLRYLALGIGGVAAMTYSAYLGGLMVYEHGVGVSPAGGLRPARAPRLGSDRGVDALRIAGANVVDGIRTTAQSLTRGEIVPWLTERDRSPLSLDQPEA